VKHHLLTERKGLPLAVLQSPPRVHDIRMGLPLVDAVPPIRTRHGTTRHRPYKLHADKAYSSVAMRAELMHRGITPRIARKGIDSSVKLGRHRWVVERTFAWLHAFKRLRTREERRGALHQAMLHLGCSVVLVRRLPVRLRL
jgi:transposase